MAASDHDIAALIGEQDIGNIDIIRHDGNVLMVQLFARHGFRRRSEIEDQ
jgi:hypothetical protein